MDPKAFRLLEGAQWVEQLCKADLACLQANLRADLSDIQGTHISVTLMHAELCKDQDASCRVNPWLPLSTEAPVIMPYSIDFSFFFFYCCRHLED